jgi:hypothetical protein
MIEGLLSPIHRSRRWCRLARQVERRAEFSEIQAALSLRDESIMER